jgi:hypothetical protein
MRHLASYVAASPREVCSHGAADMCQAAASCFKSTVECGRPATAHVVIAAMALAD